MKTWQELSREEKRKVFDKEVNETLTIITEVPDLFLVLEKEIEQAWKIAKENQTPWFFSDILFHELNCKLKIYKIVLYYLNRALFRAATEPIVISI